ncbi:MAG: DUF362 domain-containing protein [Chitinispirillaceae bacterium]|nr:DUF362 domain-containing protein [Chitinispirillaceae bacterium]
MRISRRSFLKSSAATAAVSMVSGPVTKVIAKEKADMQMQPGPGNKWPGRVAINFNGSVTSGSTVDETVAKKMVDDTIMLLTGETSVGAAWKAVFPASLTAQSKIAIKTNILNSGIPCPHASTVQAIAEGLLQMDFSGSKIPAANITVYDMNNSSSLSSAGYTSSRFPGMNLVKDSASKFGDGAMNDRGYAKTLNAANFLINVFSPRGHNTGSTFTIGFKSHYGTYENASGLHSNAAQNHRDINCTGPVYNKTVLSMCSGIFGMRESRGPVGSADDYSNYVKTVDPESTAQNPSTIIMSTDPVSCDMQSIKMMRLQKNPAGPYGVSDMPTYLQASAGISGALSGTTYNIGVIDETKMDVRRMINGQIVSTVVSGKIVDSPRSVRLKLTHLKGRGIAFIEYTVPQIYIGREASIEIYSVRGDLLFRTKQRICGAVNHYSWKEAASAGRRAPNGIYVVTVTSGKLRLAERLRVAG